ncbi:MAG TPA: MaoC family dehydratase [Steroidobacteraceae bacterium]|nr:MaoC family dehydratase [Steroidobacteraceae bacterium]
MKFKDFVAGASFRAGPRAVGEQEIVEFARRYDPQPFHVDRQAAAATRWGGLIASGWMTCAIAMELAVGSVLAGSDSIGSPGVEELRWERPVRGGDRLALTVNVLDTRVSSAGSTGIVRWRWEMYNQRGERVLSMLATSLFDAGGPASA